MKVYLSVLAIVLILMQFIRIDVKNSPTDSRLEIKADENVSKLLHQSCYDCHSNSTNWPWYSSVAPISWFVKQHVREGRKAINFSQYAKIDPKIKAKRLKRAIQTVRNGMMPLPSYTWIHKDAKLTKKQKAFLADFFQKELDKLEAK